VLVPSQVLWAQRRCESKGNYVNYVYLNLQTPDVPKADLQITTAGISFTGEYEKGVTYQLSLNWYAEFDPRISKVRHISKEVELVLFKKEGSFGHSLMKGGGRHNFLKADWNDVESSDSSG
jgi:hypothetical protein